MMATSRPEMPEHIAIAYKDAIENIMFYKRQQWTITNYAILVYAAVYALRGLTPTDVGKTLLTVLALATAAYNVYVVFHLQSGITKFRGRLSAIYQDYFTCEERERLGLLGSTKGLLYQPGIVLGLISVTIAGAAVAVSSLWLAPAAS